MIDDNQGRLQEYGVDVEPAAVEDPEPACERCGETLDEPGDARREFRSRPEHQLDVVDLYREGGTRRLCDECHTLEQYLRGRHGELVQQHGVVGAVAVFCPCQDRDEVDVRPVRRGESFEDVACSRCGSREIVVEELPPTIDDAPEGWDA